MVKDIEGSGALTLKQAAFLATVDFYLGVHRAPGPLPDVTTVLVIEGPDGLCLRCGRPVVAHVERRCW